MAWSNIEVQAVEIVQDMSYEKMRERLNQIIDKQGYHGIVNEIKKNFDIAVKAVEKKDNDINECLFQCDESLKIAVGNVLLVLDKISEIVGLSILKENMLGIMEAGMYNIGTRESLRTMADCCRKQIEEEIELLEAWEDIECSEKAKKLKILTSDEKGKSIFMMFADSIICIVNYASSCVHKQNGRQCELEFYKAVSKTISFYVSNARNGNIVFGSKTKQVIAKVVTEAINRYNEKIIQAPFQNTFCSKLNKV